LLTRTSGSVSKSRLGVGVGKIEFDDESGHAVCEAGGTAQ
jgi:hypothetical protein